MSSEVKQTQQHTLRAMAMNYAEGHAWDRLDSEACAKAADEIAALEAECERLTTQNRITGDMLETLLHANERLHAERNALRAELAAINEQKPVAYLAGFYRDVIERRSDCHPLGAEISFVDMGWLGQIEMFAKPVVGQDVEALAEALEATAHALVFRPSCQRDLVDPCKCRDCALARAGTALQAFRSKHQKEIKQ